MAGRGSKNTGIRLDIKLLQQEAQHRWLRPVEICEILTNYEKFQISTEPPNRPPSGSLYLFDRKALRYFRKDGHNWRKKKDGKTVREAHEKLKIGSVDVLHCYYAHGEENEYFQRRSYWLLEEEYMHIVFVHYLEVKVEIENPSRESSSEEIEEEPSLELRSRNSKLIDTATSSRSEDLMTINELVWRPEIPRRGIAPGSGTPEIPISNGRNVSQGALKKVVDSSSKGQRTSKMKRINSTDTSLSLDEAITTDSRSNPIEACREPVLEETLETMEVPGEPSRENTSMPEEASRELTFVGISRLEEFARMPRVEPIASQSRNRQPRHSALPPKKFHTIIEKLHCHTTKLQATMEKELQSYEEQARKFRSKAFMYKFRAKRYSIRLNIAKKSLAQKKIILSKKEKQLRKMNKELSDKDSIIKFLEAELVRVRSEKDSTIKSLEQDLASVKLNLQVETEANNHLVSNLNSIIQEGIDSVLSHVKIARDKFDWSQCGGESTSRLKLLLQKHSASSSKQITNHPIVDLSNPNEIVKDP